MKPFLAVTLFTFLVGCGSDDESNDTLDLSSIEGSPNCASIQNLRGNSYGGTSLDSVRRGSAAVAVFDTTYSYECFLGVYKYAVTADQEIIASVTVPEDKDYNLYFYNAAGTRVASSENQGKGVDESINYKVTSSDSTPLYVQVYDQLASSTTRFELLLRGSSIVAEQEDNDTNGTAQALTGTYVTVTGEIDDIGDYFKIPVTTGKQIKVTANATLAQGEQLYVTLSSVDESVQFAQIDLYTESQSAEMSDSATYTITAGTDEVLIWVDSIFNLNYSFTVDIADATSTNQLKKGSIYVKGSEFEVLYWKRVLIHNP